MAKPNSRATFLDYCLRALGAPVIEINVDDDQADDIIDEALQFYQAYHMDAIEKVYLKHKVTNSQLIFQAVTTGTFVEGETITGGTSGAKAVVKSVPTTSTLRYNVLKDSNVPFQASETVTGETSGATGVISSSGGIVIGDMENGYTLNYRSTHTIYQHEYRVISQTGRHNSSINPSATFGRSGSYSVGVGKTGDYTFFPPGDNPSGGFNSTGSFKSFYEATQHYENFVTHSEFRPYITTIGLYNDAGELLVVGRTSRPIKNDDKVDMSFVVRFDV